MTGIALERVGRRQQPDSSPTMHFVLLLFVFMHIKSHSTMSRNTFEAKMCNPTLLAGRVVAETQYNMKHRVTCGRSSVQILEMALLRHQWRQLVEESKL